MASVKLETPESTDGPIRVERSMHERLSRTLRGSFWPDAVFLVLVLSTVLFAVLLVLSIVNPAPIGTPADPLNKDGFLPRPAWYFYFLFVILEIFKGPLVLVGTLILPTLLVLVMLGLPFYDRNPSRKPKDRPVAMIVGYGLMGIVVAFTIYGVATAPASPSAAAASTGPIANPTFDKDIKPLFQSSGCYTCHSASGGNQGGYNLETADQAINSGSVKPAIKPGDPTGSLLVQALLSPNNPLGAQMPLGGKPLSPDSITTVENWVKAGAK